MKKVIKKNNLSKYSKPTQLAYLVFLASKNPKQSSYWTIERFVKKYSKKP